MNDHQAQQNNNASASIDIGNVLGGIWARKHWVVITTLVAAVASVAFVITAKPEFTASARVIVENQETNFSRTDPRLPTTNTIGQQEVKSQVEVLHSRDLAKKVITALELTKKGEFDPARRGIGPVSKFLISLGFKTDPGNQSPMQRALGVYYKKMTAYQIPESKVIVISMKSKSAKTAAAVANKLAEEFVKDTRSVQFQTTDRARDWLQVQVDNLRKEVLKSETKTENFRAKAGLLKGRDQNTTLSSQELSELNTQIILAEAQRSEIQARAKAIRNLLVRTGSVATSSEVLNSPLIQRLRERQITLRGNLTELSTTYLSNHPRVVSARSQLNGLNRQIRSEALKIVSGLEQQAKVATAREASLRASLNGLKTRASGTNIEEVKLRGLEREAEANRTMLKIFLTKLTDANSRLVKSDSSQNPEAQAGLARLFSRADVPSVQSFPKPGPTVILATIGGMVLSLGVAFMAAVMSAVSGGGASTSSQTRRKEVTRDVAPALEHSAPVDAGSSQIHAAAVQQAPVFPNAPQNDIPAAPVATAPVAMTTPSLSQLPSSASLQIAAANALAVIQNNSSEFSVGIAPVSSWANSARQTLGAKRLAVVGMPGTDIDTAATCLGLARSLAAQNIRTIIVDASMQGSLLAEMTGTANLPGLADLLTGYASFLDVIIKDDHSNARIMRVGQPLAAAWPLLSGDRMETVLAALDSDENLDMVIIHGGTLSGQATIENGAVTKCQSALLLVSQDQAAMAGNAMQKLAATGMRSSQYVRIVDGGGLRQMPDNVTPLNAAYATNAAIQGQQQAAQPATAMHNAPLFPKVAV